MAHILVIDGDRAVGTAIQKALEHEGQVGVAGAGPAGSKAVPSETFDLATVRAWAAAMKLSSRLTLVMVGLVVATAIAVGWLTYRNLETAILPRALERVESRVRLLAAELAIYVRSARADIVGFRSAVALNGIVRAHVAGGIDPLDGTTRGGLATAHGGAVCDRARVQARLFSIPASSAPTMADGRSYGSIVPARTARSASFPMPSCRKRAIGPISKPR